MDICFEGVGQVAATFQVEDGEDIQAGMAVTLKDSGTVGLGGGGDAVCGVLLGGVRGGAAAVQISGVAKVGYSGGEAPSVGWRELVCDEKGRVRVESGGAKCLVLAVDKGEQSVVVKL